MEVRDDRTIIEQLVIERHRAIPLGKTDRGTLLPVTCPVGERRLTVSELSCTTLLDAQRFGKMRRSNVAIVRKGLPVKHQKTRDSSLSGLCTKVV